MSNLLVRCLSLLVRHRGDKSFFDFTAEFSDFSIIYEVGHDDDDILTIVIFEIYDGGVVVNVPIFFVWVVFPANFVVDVDIFGKSAGEALAPIVGSDGLI